MTLNAVEIQQVIDIASRAAREMVQGSVRSQGFALPIPKVRTGQVTLGGFPGDAVQVQVDGDDDPIGMINACNALVIEGQRVQVRFDPPHGVLLIHAFGSPWAQYAPTIGSTGWALGSTGLAVGSYTVGPNKTVDASVGIAFGTGMTAGAAPFNITLPVQNCTARRAIGHGWCTIAGFDLFLLWVVQAGNSYGQVYALGAGTTYGGLIAATSTIPGTWASGSTLDLTISYEMA